MKPMRVKARRYDEDSAATTMSQARAIPQPTPAATPLTAASTGRSHATMARMIRLVTSIARTSNFSCASSPEMSAPALKAAPTPVSTTTRTSSRDGTDSSRSASARAISPESALKTSGRLKVRRSTPCSSETSRPGTESGLRVMPRP